jgi:hypothetical protein
MFHMEPYRTVLIALVLAIGGCQFWRKPPPAKPDVPLIDCSERAPSDALPTKPKTKDWIRWAGYSRRLLGVVEFERNLRAETADCLDRERAAGRIR